MEVGLKKHEPLYLKHRPQALDELVGQVSVQQTLKNAIEHNRLSHAYLFTGPRGTGKTSTARILAKSLNCENGPTPIPCQRCTACREIVAGVSPAVFEIDAASNNSVDDARALIERAPLVAVGGRFKLYIIDECHMLTKEAFNALLKTIEEPPAQVVFILATTEEHKVPPTIISRCQRLMFRLVGLDDLTIYLKEIANEEGINIDEEALRVISRRSGGGLRDALGLLDQASLLSSPQKPVSVNELLTLIGLVHEDVLLELSSGIFESRGQDVLSAVNKLLMEGREPAVLALELARHFLNLVKASYLTEGEQLNVDEIKKLVIGSPEYLKALLLQAPKFDRAELVQMVEQLDRLEQACRRTTQPAMALEMGLLSLCHRQDILMVRNLVERLTNLESKLGEKPLAITNTAKPQSVNSAVASLAPVSDFQADSVSDDAEVPELKEPLADVTNDAKTPDFDLDAFWSDLIDQLEERHRPTWSLVSTHAFPLNVGQKDVTIGVLRDNFQKMIENKSEHIKAASEMLLKRPVSVRVKVANQAPGKSINTKESTEKPAKLANDESAHGPVIVSTATIKTFDPQSKPTVLKEAYKLFEGPGSRQID